MWDEALKNANLEDCKDFPRLSLSNSPCPQPYGEDQTIMTHTTDILLAVGKTTIMPSRYYNQVDF